MRPLTGSARALHRIRSGDEVTDSGSSTHSRRGGRRRSGRQNCKSNQRGKQYSQNGSPPAGHMQPQPDCDTGQVVTATAHTALRIRGTARAEEDSALEQSVELMASVRDLPLPMTLARLAFLIPFLALSSGLLRVARDADRARLLRFARLNGMPRLCCTGQVLTFVGSHVGHASACGRAPYNKSSVTRGHPAPDWTIRRADTCHICY